MIGVTALAIADPAVAAAHLGDAERCHHGVVKRLGSMDVGYGDGDMVQHSWLR